MRDAARLTSEQLEEVRRLYAGDELTNVAIADRYGQRPNWVNYLATKHGWPLRGKHWRPGQKHRGDVAAPPPEPKVKRPHAHAVKSYKQILEDRKVEDAAREQATYGPLIGDIKYLQRKMPVNREGAMIRVGGVLRTEDEVRAIAARERRLEQPDPAMLGVIGQHSGHRAPSPPASGGRQGVATPAGLKIGQAVPLERKAKPVPVCEKCGEARTDAAAMCRFCREALAEEAKEKGKAPPAAPKVPQSTLRPAPYRRDRGTKAPPHSTDLGAKPKVVWLDLGLLTVDRTYQREIGDKGATHINRIVAAFNWNCYQPVVVSERDDGTYAVIDGQHRLEAARRHPLIDSLPCYIIEAPDVAAQACIFVSLNTNRLSLTSQHRFWAAHAAGEASAVALVRICGQAGVRVLRSPPSGTAPPLSLLAPMVGQALIRKYGEKPLREAVTLLAKAHPTTPMAFRAHFLVGLTRIAGDAGYSRDRAVAALAKADLQKLHAEAMNAAPAAGGGGRASATETVLRRLFGLSARGKA